MFGVVFPDRSFPMDVSSFTQIDPLHWVLDMNTFVGMKSPSRPEFDALCGFYSNKVGILSEQFRFLFKLLGIMLGHWLVLTVSGWSAQFLWVSFE